MKNMIKGIAVAALAVAGMQMVAHAEGDYTVANASTNFYASATGSASSIRDLSLGYNDTGFNYTDTYEAHKGLGGSLAIGYIMDQFRFELEATKRSNRVKGINNVEVNAPRRTLSNTSLMVNAFMDLPVNDVIAVYVGGGLGASRAALNERIANAGHTYTSNHDNVFAWQLMAGAAYSIDPHWTVSLGYRFFATTKPSFTTKSRGVSVLASQKAKRFPYSNNVELSVRYRF